MSPEERTELGLAGRNWTQDRFNFDDFISRWDELFTKIHEEKGSWQNREGYVPYEVREF